MDKGKITCLNRTIGKCENCREDYSENHPNNSDCLRHQKIKMYVFDVQRNSGKYFREDMK